MEKENFQIGFALQGIKTEQFAVFEENYSPKKETNLHTELQFKLDQTNHQIAAFLGFEFKQSKKVFIKILVSCHFRIQEESWNNFKQQKENQLIIPKSLLTHLAIITTGTTRGILFAKTEGTVFSNFIVPTININEIIKKDASFEI